MPQNRFQRNHVGDVANRENHNPNDLVNNMSGRQQCCVPGGCSSVEGLVSVMEPKDAIKVICNNEGCTEGTWMHHNCFIEWEQQVLNYLRSCGRARSWSEKQRLQNLWTKKGYDLAFKACDCRCGKGHLRKDLDYFPKGKLEEKKAKKGKNKKSVTLPVMANSSTRGTGVQNIPTHSGCSMNSRPQLRIRTSSFGSTGSSPPSSAGTPPLTPVKPRFEFFEDAEQAAAGNIFKRRTDFNVFNVLPKYQQNPYHIKMEDEGPHGNDETRCFVLSNLSTHQVKNVNCVVCQHDLPVYDRYPLIDGTFFLSPMRYNTDLQVLSDHRMMYLNAICMHCLEGSRNMRCVMCRKTWNGQTLVLGTMYSYDIFAAEPCCAYRLSCKSCKRTVLDPSCRLNFFSAYSRRIQCPFCKVEDHHFVKPLEQSFLMKLPIRKA